MVRHVEFTPEEMAYDVPGDVSDPKRYPTIGWSEKQWKRFVTFRKGFVRVAPNIRSAFQSEEAINAALRKVIEIRGLIRTPRAVNRKTA